MHKKPLIYLITAIILLLSPSLSLAQTDEMFWGGYEDEFQGATGLGDRDPREMIASLVNIALGFLGILALMLIILAGFKWMLSMGNEDKASEAKRMLFSGIVGLIIILASFGLARFAIDAIYRATT
jgi:hypothetical protein